MHENLCMKFNLELHRQFLKKTVNDTANIYNPYLSRINSVYIHGIYWVLCCSKLLEFDIEDELITEKDDILNFLSMCKCKSLVGNTKVSGYSPNPFENLGPTILSTLSGIQILILLNGVYRISEKREKTIFIQSMLRYCDKKAYFTNSMYEFEQMDIRYIYSALLSMYLLNLGELEKLIKQLPFLEILFFIEKSQNIDGGFGRRPGDESHAGYTFCAIASIALINRIYGSIKSRINYFRLYSWLKKRIIISKCHGERPGKGSVCFNGRPNKKCDVCYSWWVIASFKILKTIGIDEVKCLSLNMNSRIMFQLLTGILSHQNRLTGGFQKIPFNEKHNDNVADPLHTFLSISAISILLNFNSEQKDRQILEIVNLFKIPGSLVEIDPVSVLPYKYFENFRKPFSCSRIERFMMKASDSFIWKVIRVEELEWLDLNSETLSYNCSCGDIFWTTLDNLEKKIVHDKEIEHFEILQCESCSLKIKVTFNKKSLCELRNALKKTSYSIKDST